MIYNPELADRITAYLFEKYPISYTKRDLNTILSPYYASDITNALAYLVKHRYVIARKGYLGQLNWYSWNDSLYIKNDMKHVIGVFMDNPSSKFHYLDIYEALDGLDTSQIIEILHRLNRLKVIQFHRIKTSFYNRYSLINSIQNDETIKQLP